MKRFFKIFAALIVLLIAAVVALIIIVDPNDYKSEIEQQAGKALNRELAINGDLGWVVFPKLGIETGQIELKNAKGFSQANLAKIDHLSISIDMIPLLSGEIVLGKLSVDGLAFNLETNAQGVSNLDNIGASNSNKQSDPVEVKTDVTIDNEPTSLPKLTLAGIEISNTQLTVIDNKLGTKTALTIKLIELGKFELGSETSLDVVLGVVTDEFVGDLNLHALLNIDAGLANIALNELTVNGSLKGENVPAGKMDVSLTSKAAVQLSPVVANITELAIDVNGMKLGGDASVELLNKTKVRFNLEANKWDLNPLLPTPTEGEEVATTEPETKPTPEVEPDLSVLNTLDVDGKLTVAGFKAKKIDIGKTFLHVIVKNGTAQLAPFSVELYEGSMLLNASVSHDGGKNTYSIDEKLTGVQILPLLTDAAEVDLLSGTTNFNLTAKGSGLTVSKIKKGLAGKGDFAITDGALYGINVAQKIRVAKISLGSDTENADAEKKTDFSALNGQFTINEGVVNNTSLLMEAPFTRLMGNGTANILKELIDYHLKVTIVSTSKGQGGGTDLGGLSIPLAITGSFTDPKFKLDTSGALEEKLNEKKAELKAKAKEKLDKAKEDAKDKLKDKLKNKLKGLF